MLRLILLLTLTASCVAISSCATTTPDIYIKGVDYDEGMANNTPQDKTKWMWITHDAAKRRLKWVTK